MSKDKQMQIKEIVKNFRFEGEFIEAEPHGFGHINDTYAVYFRKKDGTTHRYILQRINNTVFSNVERLMGNIAIVTRHLRNKIIKSGGNPDRETLNLIQTQDNKSYYKSPKGDYWRAYIFIENAKTYQVVENLNHFYNAGRAFGKFQNMLSDIPANSLYEIIPGFHNTKNRFSFFMESVEKDIMNRASSVKPEIEFAVKRAEEITVLVDLLEEGKLPLRVTHNDCKFNNVMIDDETGEGICVIDLDTVMPGLSLYDFGDAIRSGANPAEEDERDLSKVTLDLDLFEQFSRGFLEYGRDFLTPLEIEYLPVAAKLMTYECGIRFLADYINGDVYFKVHREGHNLDRARTQFKMVRVMEEKFGQMKEIVRKYC
ncbi:MAG: aminoglycoside phosphotransferase family protein [Clostridiaceae bacterium]|nr:aminoglycoside phosphotransferase family protein [Clostridiaceae bacterium]